MDNNLIKVIERNLPAMSGCGVNYNSSHNMYYTNGYTSAAGNTYYQGLRLSDRLVIKYDFGQGYLYTFLNAIYLYGFDGKNTRLIATRDYYCQAYNESFARRESEEMLTEYLCGQTKLMGGNVDRNQLEQFAVALVGETLKNQRQLN
jgi:hypothetical protein